MSPYSEIAKRQGLSLEIVSYGDDISDLVTLGRIYSDETAFDHLSVDLSKVLGTVRDGLQAGVLIPIIARIDGQPVGMISAWLMDLYYTQRVAYLDMLYVLPAHRKGPLGRILVSLMEDVLKGEELNVGAFFCNALGQTSSDATIKNMFRRLGFEEAGPMFRKVF